jgi:putative PIN family toxin of toxin-antitoxin system
VRVFPDTNVLVSAFLTRGLSADVIHLVLAEYEMVVGEVVLDELARVLTQRVGAPPELVAEVEAFLREQTAAPRPPAPSDLPIPDPADAWVLASAVEAGADVLITGDRDLLDLGTSAPIPIVTPRGFWEMVRGG